METKTEVKVNVGDRVNRLRKGAGLTQQNVAEFLGVDQTYISKCESGERQFSALILDKLATLLGCELSCLVDGAVEADSLNVSYRSDSLLVSDYEVVSDINRIALNLKQMRRWLEME